MNKNILAMFRIVLVLMLAFSLLAVSTSALADDDNGDGNKFKVVGLDDAFCETPYYITNADGEYVVNPDNVIDCDVERIQAAVDGASDGDTIVLSATFNLGTEKPYINLNGNQTWQPNDLDPNEAFLDSPRGTVFITKDLKIKGKDGAKIVGGYAPFTVGMQPKPFGYEVFELDFWFIGGEATFVPVKVTVKDLAFEQFVFSGILVFSTRGIEVKNNRFEDIQLLATNIWTPIGEAVFLTGAVAAKENYPQFWLPFLYQPGDLIYGDVLIRNNYVDGNWRQDENGVRNVYTGMMVDGCSLGLSMFFANVDAVFSGNMVKNCAGGMGTGQWGRSVFKNNHVEMPEFLPEQGIGTNSYTFGTTHPGPYFKNARAVIKNNTVLVKEDVDRGVGGVGIIAREQKGTIIKDNTLTGTGEAGIATWITDQVVIKNNKVDLEEVSWGAIDLEDDVYNALVKNNKIAGSGRSAIRLGWPWAGCENNTITGNKMKGFTPLAHMDNWSVTTIGSHIELLWGAVNNTIKGNKYSAVDPSDSALQNIYFASEVPSDELPEAIAELPGANGDLPGATENVVREGKGLKIMDFTDPNGPLYSPDTYAGLNDIRLGH
jgi:hypothetical protein